MLINTCALQVSEEDIQQYRDAVTTEYEALLQNLVESEASYLEELAVPLAESFPVPYQGSEPVLPEVQMPLTRQNLMDLPDLDLDAQIRQMQWENSLREPVRPSLANILADYYSDGKSSRTVNQASSCP
jgi:hypothetical protein